MLKSQLLKFIRCHEGLLNRILHIIGLIIIALGIYYKHIVPVLAGAIIQELGHFYQYAKTGKLKDSPWTCFKPQTIFAYPIFFLIIAYVLWW